MKVEKIIRIFAVLRSATPHLDQAAAPAPTAAPSTVGGVGTAPQMGDGCASDSTGKETEITSLDMMNVANFLKNLGGYRIPYAFIEITPKLGISLLPLLLISRLD